MRAHPPGVEAALIGAVVADDGCFVHMTTAFGGGQMTTAFGGGQMTTAFGGGQLARLC